MTKGYLIQRGETTRKKLPLLHNDMGIVGVKDADPLIAYTKKCAIDAAYSIGPVVVLAYLAQSLFCCTNKKITG